MFISPCGQEGGGVVRGPKRGNEQKWRKVGCVKEREVVLLVEEGIVIKATRRILSCRFHV